MVSILKLEIKIACEILFMDTILYVHPLRERVHDIHTMNKADDIPDDGKQ